MPQYLKHAFLAGLVGAVAACGDSGSPGSDGPARVENAVEESQLATVRLTERAEVRLGIETARVQRRSVARVRSLGGDVMVPPGRDLTIAAPVAGTVLAPEDGSIVRPGIRVSAGEIIFRLVALPAENDLLRVRETVSVADARFTNAQAKATRAEQLHQDSIITLAEYEDAIEEVTSARAEARSAHARLDLIENGVASEELAPLIVQAPTAGLIQQVFAAHGQPVAAGAPLFEIVSTHPLWVRVPVYAGDLSTIETRAEARVGALSARTGSESLSARPIPAPPSANAAAASVDLFYEVQNQDGSLRPGQRVSVDLNLIERDEGLTVPWAAVVYDIQGGAWVYERIAPQTYARTRIEVRHVTGDYAVLARGPDEGAEVVSVGAAELFGTEFGVGR